MSKCRVRRSDRDKRHYRHGLEFSFSCSDFSHISLIFDAYVFSNHVYPVNKNFPFHKAMENPQHTVSFFQSWVVETTDEFTPLISATIIASICRQPC